jgi:hypothetical protein
MGGLCGIVSLVEKAEASQGEKKSSSLVPNETKIIGLAFRSQHASIPFSDIHLFIHPLPNQRSLMFDAVLL